MMLIGEPQLISMENSNTELTDNDDHDSYPPSTFEECRDIINDKSEEQQTISEIAINRKNKSLLPYKPCIMELEEEDICSSGESLEEPNNDRTINSTNWCVALVTVVLSIVCRKPFRRKALEVMAKNTTSKEESNQAKPQVDKIYGNAMIAAGLNDGRRPMVSRLNELLTKALEKALTVDLFCTPSLRLVSLLHRL